MVGNREVEVQGKEFLGDKKREISEPCRSWVRRTKGRCFSVYFYVFPLQEEYKPDDNVNLRPLTKINFSPPDSWKLLNPLFTLVMTPVETKRRYLTPSSKMSLVKSDCSIQYVLRQSVSPILTRDQSVTDVNLIPR